VIARNLLEELGFSWFFETFLTFSQYFSLLNIATLVSLTGKKHALQRQRLGANRCLEQARIGKKIQLILLRTHPANVSAALLFGPKHSHSSQVGKENYGNILPMVIQ